MLAVDFKFGWLFSLVLAIYFLSENLVDMIEMNYTFLT